MERLAIPVLTVAKKIEKEKVAHGGDEEKRGVHHEILNNPCRLIHEPCWEGKKEAHWWDVQGV